MVLRRLWRPAAAGVLLLAGLGGVSAQGNGARSGLTALSDVERGQWAFTPSGGGSVVKLCLTNPATLLQIQHNSVQCSQFVMENEEHRATIRYTCPGHGHGRTTVTVETPRLVTVDTQGILDGAPFAEEFEGRRVGACS